MKNALLYGLVLSLLFVACKEKTADKNTLPPAKAEKTLVYSIQPEQIGPNTLIALLDSLVSLGVNTLLLDGVFFRQGDSLRLAYDWFQPDPSYGNLQKLQSWIDSAHSRGLYVWIDFPASRLYQLPDWLIENKQRANAKLDLADPIIQNKLKNGLSTLVNSLQLDGFWFEKQLYAEETQLKTLLSSLTTDKKLLFAGNFKGDWLDLHLHDHNRNWVRAQTNYDTLSEISLASFSPKRLQFSANATERSRDLADQKLHFLLSALLPGPLLIKAGEEVGQLPNAYSSEILWSSNPDIRRFYKRLFQLKKTESALQTDDFRLLNSENEHILLLGRADWLIIINRSKQAQNWQIPAAYAQQNFTDMFNQREIRLEASLFMLEKGFYILKPKIKS